MSLRAALAAILPAVVYLGLLLPSCEGALILSGASAARAQYAASNTTGSTDPTLEPVVADEPIPPAGFPPLPDRLNLESAIASAGNSTQTAPSVGQRPTVNPSYHQGYGHVPAGAYMAQRQQPPAAQPYGHTPAGAYMQRQNPGGTPAARTGRDSYNVNMPGTGQAAPGLPELPTTVTVSQSTTQDLSLPDDNFSDYHRPKRRFRNGYGGSILRGYLFGAAGMATGIGMGGMRF